MPNTFTIVKIKNVALAARLISIGISPGKVLNIKRKSYFGGAYYISIEGMNYALRAEEFKELELVELKPGE